MGLVQRVFSGNWFGPGLLRGRRKATGTSASALVRDGSEMGPFGDVLGGYVPRQVNPWLYEAIREAIGPVDGAINRLITMDGILRVRGGNDALVDEIREWLENVPVNDLEGGLQAFFAGQSNEAYEQGFSVGEWVTDKAGRDIVALHVADSKGVLFRREGTKLATFYRPPSARAGRADGTDQLEAVLRNSMPGSIGISDIHGAGFNRVDPARMVYVGIHNEAGKPYGVSMIRSCEFAAQVLLKIQAATGNVWSRYGDPPLSMTYKTKSRALKQEDLDKRRDRLARDLAATMDAKRGGNSVDFVQAVAADDELVISVIGAAGSVIEIEMPARHMLEQIVAKFGIPSWMLGFHWSTAERLAEAQSTIALQESKTRFASRVPALTRLVATMLRLRGRVWRPGDWELYQELPNLQDELRQAQASFLRAQEQMMLSGVRAPTDELPGTSAEATGAAGGTGKSLTVLANGDIVWPEATRPKAVDAPLRGEPWADTDPALPRIERTLARDMKVAWRAFGEDVIAALGLPASAKQDGGWQWPGGSVVGILEGIARDYIDRIGGLRGILTRAMFDMWLRGLQRGAEEANETPSVSNLADQVRAAMQARALELVRGNFDRNWTDRVLRELEEGRLNGLGERDVARRLREMFAGVDYDWERLAASEMVLAHARGKLAEYAEIGITQFEWMLTADAKVCRICVEHGDGGPYEVAAGAPLPMIDSHPHCRCSIAPVL